MPKTSDHRCECGAERYLVALGSNVRHHRYGSPAQVLNAALKVLRQEPGVTVAQAAPLLASPPLGPSRRRYANGGVLLTSDLAPEALLLRLKAIERRFGRRRGGRRWTARVLDLDILLWSGGTFVAPGLVVPHVAFRERGFALGPAMRIAPRWRDPITGLTLQQLHARLTRPRPLPIRGAWSGP